MTDHRILAQEADACRGSINFLLNGGTNSFIDCFRFPPPAEQRNLYSHSHQQPGTDILGQFSGSESVSYESDLTNWPNVGNYNFLNFGSNSFPNFPCEISPTSQMNLRDWEAPSVQSSGNAQCIRDRATMIYANPQQQTEMDPHLNYIFAPSLYY
ncbi:C2H2 finger domain protein [Erysiphe neolycopersici]|uniref:C2H2 finger domain protein n=1 Tax=Erysiphe neolycopersici TaxID=212602 RepID=A0A420I073_9PEZI|nr:C2H2 finger domain protein [Erysiphe neolycopersici]